jgi:hypothetical protein
MLPLEIGSISGAGLGIRKHKVSGVLNQLRILFQRTQNTSNFFGLYDRAGGVESLRECY